MLTRGIILLATGQPFYGRMAYNLAVTIKSVEDISITILHNGAALSHLSSRQKNIFDTIIEIQPTSFAAKLSLLDFTPYDQTLYLDVDMVWLPNKTPSDLFAELEGVKFTSIAEGYYDYDTSENKGNKMYHFWVDPIEAQKKYNLKGKFYQWRSEVMYFTKEAKQLFNEAKKIYASPKVEVKQFAGHLPDEAAINIAACKLGIEPNNIEWKPSYWHRLYGEGRGLNEILNKYYLMSAGGNFASRVMKDSYNNVCKAAHRVLGLQYLFTLQSKKSVMPDRIKM